MFNLVVKTITVHASSLEFLMVTVLKNNWNTNICSSVHDLPIIKKGHMKKIRKGLGRLEDYGRRSRGRSTRSQHP